MSVVSIFQLINRGKGNKCIDGMSMRATEAPQTMGSCTNQQVKTNNMLKRTTK